jgi:ABC-type sugar transport system ATPase subunit
MCLAGENGAGKSTLIKILTGAIRRDSGEYLIDGEDIGSPSPAQAREAGIGVVYQELSLLPDLSVGENLLMGQLPSRRGVTRPAELRKRAKAMLDRVGLDWLDPGTEVATLSLATQQLVEIAKVLGASPRVLIFDEPTTALSESETKALLARIHQLRDEGHAVMYVTHHLEEMFEIGDRVTILRDGGLVTCKPIAEFDHDSLIASMVGRKIESLYPASKRTIGATRLHVNGLQPQDAAGPIDFEVRAGEIVGIAGLLGSGRSELLRAIFGADPVAAGHIEVDGQKVRPGDPRRAVQAGVASSISTWAACACARPAGSSRCPRCRAATSRRCCSPAGWRPRRRCSCSTSRPRASTWGPRPRSTRSSATSRPKGSAWSSCRPTCPRSSGSPTACS